MKLSNEQISSIEKVAGGLSLPTGTFNNAATFAQKSFKSMDKIFGQGQKALKPGKLPGIKPANPPNAFTTQKGMTGATKGLGKIANQHGEYMNNIGNYYTKGVHDAFEKLAMPQPGQPQPQQPMGQAQPMAQPPQEQQAPMVGGQMDDVQQSMAAQASPEELQNVQNSGITAGDIASAAKVIQTMAEMKASADMSGIQAVDPTGAQAPGAPAPIQG